MSRLVKLRVQRFNQSLENLKYATSKFETRIKGTIVENWVKYWKTVFNDYRDVARDVTTNIKEKPFKAIVIMSGLGFLVASAKCNPSFTDFRDQYIKSSNRMILVHPNVQNNEALQHLRFTEMCHNQLQIRRLNFIIGSIIWRDDSSSLTKTYDANCPYLQVQYSKFKDRILDIGFFNRWWILEVIVHTHVQFSLVASFFKHWKIEQTFLNGKYFALNLIPWWQCCGKYERTDKLCKAICRLKRWDFRKYHVFIFATQIFPMS